MATCVLIGGFLVAASYPWRNHPTYEMVHNVSWMAFLMLIALAGMFLAGVGCPNPACVGWPLLRRKKPGQWNLLEVDEEGQAINREDFRRKEIAFDMAFKAVFTRSRYECPKCHTLLREGISAKWSAAEYAWIVAIAWLLARALMPLVDRIQNYFSNGN